MTSAATQDEINDHNHDHRKNWEAPPPINAIEIALLVKGLKDITEAAKLIDDYAATVAAGAKLEGVQQAYDRMNAVFDNSPMLKRGAELLPAQFDGVQHGSIVKVPV